VERTSEPEADRRDVPTEDTLHFLSIDRLTVSWRTLRRDAGCLDESVSDRVAYPGYSCGHVHDGLAASRNAASQPVNHGRHLWWTRPHLSAEDEGDV